MVKPWILDGKALDSSCTICDSSYYGMSELIPGLETNSSPGCFGNMTISLLLVP